MRFAGKQITRFQLFQYLILSHSTLHSRKKKSFNVTYESKCFQVVLEKFSQIFRFGLASPLTMLRGEYRNHVSSQMHHSNSDFFITDKHKSTTVFGFSVTAASLFGFITFYNKSTLNAFKCKHCTQNHF